MVISTRLRYGHPPLQGAQGVDFEQDYLQKVSAQTARNIQELCKRLVSAGNRIQVTMKSN